MPVSLCNICSQVLQTPLWHERERPQVIDWSHSHASPSSSSSKLHPAGLQPSLTASTSSDTSCFGCSRLFRWPEVDHSTASYSRQRRRILLPAVTCVHYRTAATAHMEEEVDWDEVLSLPSPSPSPSSSCAPPPLIEAKVTGHLTRIQLAASDSDSDAVPAALEKRDFFFLPWCEGGDGETEGLLLELVDADLGRFRSVGSHCLRRSRREGESRGAAAAAKEDVEVKEIRSMNPERLPCWFYDVATREHTIFIV